MYYTVVSIDGSMYLDRQKRQDKARQGHARPRKITQDKTSQGSRPDKIAQDKTSQGSRPDKAMQDQETRQGKADRQADSGELTRSVTNKARQGKTRQCKTR